MTLSNQTSRCICKCIRIVNYLLWISSLFVQLLLPSSQFCCHQGVLLWLAQRVRLLLLYAHVHKTCIDTRNFINNKKSFWFQLDWQQSCFCRHHQKKLFDYFKILNIYWLTKETLHLNSKSCYINVYTRGNKCKYGLVLLLIACFCCTSKCSIWENLMVEINQNVENRRRFFLGFVKNSKWHTRYMVVWKRTMIMSKKWSWILSFDTNLNRLHVGFDIQLVSKVWC